MTPLAKGLLLLVVASIAAYIYAAFSAFHGPLGTLIENKTPWVGALALLAFLALPNELRCRSNPGQPRP